MTKIKYSAGSSSAFFQSLNKSVQEQLVKTGRLKKAKKLLWLKMIFYTCLHLTSYIILFSQQDHSLLRLILCYVFIGLSGILLGFNVSHDACHDTFSRNKLVNTFLYHFSFNMQGTSAWLWKIRHNSSHHVFPNVDGCDADIDNNPFLRLSPQHPLKKHQRYQHIYAVAVYSIYTLHWFLVKDVAYLFRERIANIVNKGYSLKQLLLFAAWKIVYALILIALPVWLGFPLVGVITAFFIMHIINGLVFIHVLIATHLCMETQFPVVDETGELPFDFCTHQLATSLDYSPLSKVCNFFLGGFNAHAAHHLYPRFPHTIYPEISKLIQEKVKEFNMPYNELSLPAAIRSHYRYLKMMGNPGNKSVVPAIS